MKPNNRKSKLVESKNNLSPTYSLIKVSSQKNITLNQSKNDHINKPPSSVNNTQNNISFIAQNMKSFGFNIHLNEESSQPSITNVITNNKKESSQIKQLAICPIDKGLTRRNGDSSQGMSTKCLKGRNKNNQNEIKQSTLILPSNNIAISHTLYSKNPKTSHKSLKIFLSKNADERSEIIKSKHSNFVIPICNSKKMKRTNNNSLTPLNEDEKINFNISMNKLSMILARVKEYTNLQIGLRNIHIDLLKKSNTTINPYNEIKERAMSNKKANNRMISSLSQTSITEIKDNKKDSFIARVRSAPKILSGKDNKSKLKEMVKRSKDQLHWTHKIVNPNLNSRNSVPSNLDCLYKININETSSWKKDIENLIKGKSITDREIIQYFIE